MRVVAWCRTAWFRPSRPHSCAPERAGRCQVRLGCGWCSSASGRHAAAAGGARAVGVNLWQQQEQLEQEQKEQLKQQWWCVGVAEPSVMGVQGLEQQWRWSSGRV